MTQLQGNLIIFKRDFISNISKQKTNQKNRKNTKYISNDP